MREKPGDVIATAFALYHGVLFAVMVGYKSLPDVALMYIIWIYLA